MDQQAIAATFVPHNGPVLMGTNVVWMLYGCFLVQLYNYAFYNSSNDRWLRVLVLLITVTGALHLVVVTSTQWIILVENWGDPHIWVKSPSVAGHTPFMSALNGVIVQLFFVGQILRMAGGNTIISCVAIATICAALVAFGAAIADSIQFLNGGAAGLETGKLWLVTRIWLITTALTDVTISATMSFILYMSQRQSTLQGTKRLVSALIVQSVETGSVTAVVMILCLLCAELMRWNSVFAVWEFASGPLYGNVLLFVLNSRRVHRERAGCGDGENYTLGDLSTSIAIARHHTTISCDATQPSAAHLKTRTPGAGVKVTKEIRHEYEYEESDIAKHPLERLSLSRSSGSLV